jgi:hypothetical protein
MATATKKKANKKPASKAKSSGTATKASANTVKAKTKVKAPAKVKTATKGQATQTSTAPSKPATNPVTNPVSKSGVTKKAVVKKTEPCSKQPDRSSPAMAEVDADVLEFIAAIDEFKQVNGRPFPSWSEVLLVVRQLGYRRA